MKNQRPVFGYSEKIHIKQIGGVTVQAPPFWAKVDSGAFSGVVHAEDIIETDGQLEFDLLGKKLHVSTRDYLTRTVRNTHGGEKTRYLVNVKFEIDGQEYQTKIGLDDRQNMKFDALLGRYFINSVEGLIDPQKNIQNDKEWKQMGE